MKKQASFPVTVFILITPILFLWFIFNVAYYLLQIHWFSFIFCKQSHMLGQTNNKNLKCKKQRELSKNALSKGQDQLKHNFWKR